MRALDPRIYESVWTLPRPATRATPLTAIAMRQAAYPQAPQHYAAHRHLLSSIANLLYALRGAQPAPVSGLALKDWLATHLAGEDASLYAFLGMARP